MFCFWRMHTGLCLCVCVLVCVCICVCVCVCISLNTRFARVGENSHTCFGRVCILQARSCMMKALVLLGIFAVGVRATFVECPLAFNDQELLVMVGPIAMIVDTGSSETIVFGKAGSSEYFVDYQDMHLGVSPLGSVAFNGCSAPLVVPHVSQSEGGLGGGILGLGRAKLGNAFLFSQDAPRWKTMSITVDKNKSMFVLLDSNLRVGEFLLPVNSQYYWSTPLESITVADARLLGTTSVIFDTGSNFFGLSPGIYKSITDAIIRDGCKSDLVLEFGGVTLAYPPSVYSINASKCQLAIGEINQEKFGDLSNQEIVIIGTRGLMGKTINIHKSSKNEYGFVMSIINS